MLQEAAASAMPSEGDSAALRERADLLLLLAEVHKGAGKPDAVRTHSACSVAAHACTQPSAPRADQATARPWMHCSKHVRFSAHCSAAAA